MKDEKSPERAALDAIIDELAAEAHSDDERIWNFQQAFQKHVSLPCDGFVIGEPVKWVSFNYDGNQRRGVTSTCPPGSGIRSGGIRSSRAKACIARRPRRQFEMQPGGLSLRGDF
jgi:hypothetical protein